MGGIVSLGSLACCFTSTACTATCAACPSSCNNSTLSRIMYVGILLLTAIVSCIMLAPGVQDWLTKLPICEESVQDVGPAVLSEIASSVQIRCTDAIGYLAVYRICLVVTVFFFLMALIMIGVERVGDFRSGIQNGFWGLKYLLLLAGCIGAFFIPHGSFGTTWMYFGMIGGFSFILVQLVFIIDVAHLWAEKWGSKLHSSRNRNWFWALLAASAAMYALAFAGIVFCYTYYTGLRVGDCKLHEFFISFNFILCVILSVISILPQVQEYQENSGLLQASFVSLYIVYLTWSTMTNQPDSLCKPDILSDILLRKTTNTTTEFINQPHHHRPQMTTASIIGLVIWFACVLYSSIQTSKPDQAAKLTMTDTVTLTEHDGGESDTASTMVPVDYNWSIFHVMFGLATLYVMMTLTNWYSPGKNVDLETISANMSAVWVKIISSWLCFAIYLWTLIVPILLPDRDFPI